MREGICIDNLTFYKPNNNGGCKTQSKMNKLFNHTSLETAYKVDNYPYGYTLRTSIFYWIETTPKRGDRFCSCTINPKNGRMNAPKKSTYYAIAFMYLNEKNHVTWAQIHNSDMGEKAVKFGELMGIENMNKEQRKQYNALCGINEVVRDEFTDKVKKDFAVKWEKDSEGKCDEVKITFDRPDGVSLKEIFKAMKSLNQAKLDEVFSIRESRTWGAHPGTVRVCVRGGMQLGIVSEESYKNYLASDVNITEEEAVNV
jgi:hypothetical protein